MKYKKKPVVVDAVRWEEHNDHMSAIEAYHSLMEQLLGKISDPRVHIYERHDPIPLSNEFKEVYVLSVDTLEGRLRCEPGNWLIRGVEGELYPCKDSVFRDTYEKAYV